MSRLVLVTGASGQTGSYLSELLDRRGHRVVGVSSSDSATTRPARDSVRLDVRDHVALRRLILDRKPDVIVNLAAQSSVARSWEDPGGTAAVNAMVPALILRDVSDLAASGVDCHVVQASSSEIFGRVTGGRADESTPLAPTNPYGAAKAHAHHLAAVYRARGVRASSMILFNHESPRRPRRFVSRTITTGVASMARGDTDRLLLQAPSIRRDWGWAPDVADAILRLIESDEPDDYVIATGRARSVHEFATTALRAAGFDDPDHLLQVDGSPRPIDVPVIVGDSTKARDRLGWSPTVAFDELVRRMVEADLGATASVS